MPFDRTAIRRATLAHCLTFAELDEAYATWAARNYETRWPELFDGLERRFLADLSRAKADKAKEVAHG